MQVIDCSQLNYLPCYSTPRTYTPFLTKNTMTMSIEGHLIGPYAPPTILPQTVEDSILFLRVVLVGVILSDLELVLQDREYCIMWKIYFCKSAKHNCWNSALTSLANPCSQPTNRNSTWGSPWEIEIGNDDTSQTVCISIQSKEEWSSTSSTFPTSNAPYILGPPSSSSRCPGNYKCCCSCSCSRTSLPPSIPSVESTPSVCLSRLVRLNRTVGGWDPLPLQRWPWTVFSC